MLPSTLVLRQSVINCVRNVNNPGENKKPSTEHHPHFCSVPYVARSQHQMNLNVRSALPVHFDNGLELSFCSEEWHSQLQSTTTLSQKVEKSRKACLSESVRLNFNQNAASRRNFSDVNLCLRCKFWNQDRIPALGNCKLVHIEEIMRMNIPSAEVN